MRNGGENGAAGFTVDAKAEINVYSDAQSIGYKETLFSIKDRTDGHTGGLRHPKMDYRLHWVGSYG